MSKVEVLSAVKKYTHGSLPYAKSEGSRRLLLAVRELLKRRRK